MILKAYGHLFLVAGWLAAGWLAAAEPRGRATAKPPPESTARERPAAGAPADSPGSEARIEATASSVLYGGVSAWNAELAREWNRLLPTLPDPIAGRILWLAAAAPESVEAGRIFATALASPSAIIRAQAAALVTGLKSSGDRERLLAALVGREGDSELLLQVIDGLAAKPFPASVSGLMEIMPLIGPKQPKAEAAAAAHLRNLTRNSLPASASAWNDWWKTNSRQYQ
ncbi:MAG: hypothetical protein LBU64_01885 [Planctomycetota bacterium]|nr:hypothetical protein [Planctomycetota bacterium]